MNLSTGMFSFCQDTTQFSYPPNGSYWVDIFDSTRNSWLRQDFIDSVLFSTEELDTSKFYPTGKFIGYYKNGSVAFKRSCFFDGEYSELHGVKEVYYNNGNPKERGNYIHGVKSGVWKYYNSDGSLKRSTEYYAPITDSLSSFSSLSSFPEKITNDTITLESETSFHTTFPCASFGKNGTEIIYNLGEPIEVRRYQYDSLLVSTTNRTLIDHITNNQFEEFRSDTINIFWALGSGYNFPIHNYWIRIYKGIDSNIRADLISYPIHSYELHEMTKMSRKQKKLNQLFLKEKNIQLNTEILCESISYKQLFDGWDEDILIDSVWAKLSKGEYKSTSFFPTQNHRVHLDSTYTLSKSQFNQLQNIYLKALLNEQGTRPHNYRGFTKKSYIITVKNKSGKEDSLVGENLFYDWFDINSVFD